MSHVPVSQQNLELPDFNLNLFKSSGGKLTQREEQYSAQQTLWGLTGWIYTTGLESQFPFVAYIWIFCLFTSNFKKWAISHICIYAFLKFAYTWNNPHK